MNIGKSLRIVMAVKQISNSDLAEKLGLQTPMAISYYRNKEKINMMYVDRLAKALDMTTEEFVAVADLVPDFK